VSPRARSRFLLGAIVLPIAVAKLVLSTHTDRFGPDGSYYFDVARSVRDGLGLQTWVSLYHEGFESFPHPTPIYPLWPLVLGYAGRLVSLEWVAVWLPTALWFATLLFVARLGATLSPGPLFPGTFPPFDAGHLAVLALGYNPLFFHFTSRPYTEGLGWFLAFVAVARARRFWSSPSPAGAVELGVWGGTLVLVRSQMLTFAMAWFLMLALRVACGPDRKRTSAWLVLGLVGFGASLLPYYLWIATFVHPFDPLVLVRFDRYRASDAQGHITMLRSAHSALGWLAERAEGFGEAYAWNGRYTYRENFGLLQWAPVALAVVLAADLWRRGRGALPAWTIDDPFTWFVWLWALAGYFSIHAIHKSFMFSWNFATRHALATLPLMWGAAVVLARRSPRGRQLAALLVVGGVLLQWRGITATLREDLDEPSTAEHWRSLCAWLVDAKREDADLRVAFPSPQELARQVPGVGLHWTDWNDTVTDFEALTDRLQVDYVIIPTHRPRYAHRLDADAFDKAFVLVAGDIDGYDVFRRAGVRP
jgi:hypothetical protein